MIRARRAQPAPGHPRPDSPRRAATPGRVAGGIILANAVALAVFGIGPVAQAQVALLLLGVTCLGHGVLASARIDRVFDRQLLVVLSFVTGAGVFVACNFLLFHFEHPRAIRLVNIAVLTTAAVHALFAWWRSGARQSRPRSDHRNVLTTPEMTLCLLLATLMAITTLYNPDWGQRGDLNHHLGAMVTELTRNWLPPASLIHLGLQIFLAAIDCTLGRTNGEWSFSGYGWVGFSFLACQFFLVAYLGKRFLALHGPWVAVLVLSTAFFGAINYPLFALDHASYLGLFNFSGYFHNQPQLTATVIGLSALVCLLISRTGAAYTYTLAAFLAATSFFFKPSFFTVLAPVMMLMGLLDRRRLNLDRLIGYAILVAVAVSWWAYPLIFDIGKLETDLLVRPFAVLFHYSSRYLPEVVLRYPLLHAAVTLILSFALPLFAASIAVARFRPGSWREDMPWLREALPILLLFVLGTAQAILFVENNRRMFHGNFTWAFQSAYLATLPLVVKLLSLVRPRALLAVATGLLLLHLWGGALRYGRFLIGSW